jgi:hypothetical protein
VLRRSLVVVFTVTLLASFAWCLVLTDAGSPWAFFGLPTRAWEFAAAALLAAIPVARLTMPRGARTVLVAAGLGSIAAATLLFSGATPYPGAYALVPVVGTLLVVIAGIGPDERPRDTAANPLSDALAARPAQWIGRVSYSWYLWHWPLVLLAVTWLDRDTLAVRVVAVGVALIAAALAHRFVENPVRYGSRFTSSAPRTFALGGGLTVVALVASVGVVTYADREVAGEDLLAELEEVRATRTKVDCTVARETEGGDRYCLEGDPDGDVTILMAGDSHARHWQKTFAEVAASEGIRLLVRYRGACPSSNVPVIAPGSLKVDDVCTRFQTGTEALIVELEPDAVVLSNTAAYVVAPDEPRYSPEGKGRFWADGFRQRVVELRDRGIPVGVVADNPRLAYDPIDCVIENGTADECRFARTEGFADDMGAIWAAERAAAAELGLPELDINPELCPDDVCLVQLDGEWVYTDDSHLYAGFTATRRPAVEDFLRQLVGSIETP